MRNGCCLCVYYHDKPSACPSWSCFLCILLVANSNIMHLKMLTAARARGLSFPARAQLSLSLSLHLFCSASGWKELRFPLSVKSCRFSNFTCKYSRNHSTAIVFVLCVAYLIFSDDGSIINQDFWQINILEGRAVSLVLMGRVSVTISY